MVKHAAIQSLVCTEVSVWIFFEWSIFAELPNTVATIIIPMFTNTTNIILIVFTRTMEWRLKTWERILYCSWKLFLSFICVIYYSVDNSANFHKINYYGFVYLRISAYRLLGYERVYLPLCEVSDTPFYIQGDDLLSHITIASLVLGSSRFRFSVFYQCFFPIVNNFVIYYEIV